MFLVFIAVTGVVLRNPSLLVNTRTFTWAVKKFGPRDYPISWSQADVEARSMAWLQKGVSFSFKGLCIEEREKQALHACFESVRFDFEVALIKFTPRITVLGPIEILGGDVRADLDRIPPRSTVRQADGCIKALCDPHPAACI